MAGGYAGSVETVTATATAVDRTGVRVRWELVDEDQLDIALEGALDDVDPATVAAAAAAVEAVAAQHPGRRLRLVADHPATTPFALPAAVAGALGLTTERRLLQLRRPLPVAADDPGRSGAPPVRLRPFQPDRDEEAWLRANNAAFAGHPSQADWTRDDLDRTLAEPWVDLDGFLVSDDPDRPGELLGFCWTRIHPSTATEPALGEIFVIGVAPAHHGRRLGATLVLAGLDHLAWRGIGTGMLYVEHDNAPARRLYERLGFVPHLVREISVR